MIATATRHSPGQLRRQPELSRYRPTERLHSPPSHSPQSVKPQSTVRQARRLTENVSTTDDAFLEAKDLSEFRLKCRQEKSKRSIC